MFNIIVQALVIILAAVGLLVSVAWLVYFVRIKRQQRASKKATEEAKVLVVYANRARLKQAFGMYKEIYKGWDNVRIDMFRGEVFVGEHIIYLRVAENYERFQGLSVDVVYVYEKGEIRDYEKIKNDVLLPMLAKKKGKLVEL